MRGTVAVFRFNMILIALVSMSLIFALPAPRRWLSERILSANVSPFYQMRHTGLQDRLESRYNKDYRVYQQIARLLAPYPDALVLLPPSEFVAASNNPNISSLPEPSVFYYFTGVRGIYPDNPLARRANWLFVVGQKDVGLRRIKRQSQIDSAFLDYQPYMNQ